MFKARALSKYIFKRRKNATFKKIVEHLPASSCGNQTLQPLRFLDALFIINRVKNLLVFIAPRGIFFSPKNIK